MEIVITLAMLVIVAIAGWIIYSRKAEDENEAQEAPAKLETTGYIAVAPVEPSAVKPIYEQPTRSEASDVYAQPVPPVEPKVRKPRAKKVEAPKVEAPKAKAERPVKQEVAAAWPLEKPKSRRGKKAAE